MALTPQEPIGALFDTELTVKVLGLLKNKQPDLWHEYLKTKKIKLLLKI